MTQDEFIQTVQSRAARIAVGASTVRGRGNAGAVAASRTFLRRLDLATFGVSDSTTFEAELNRATDELRVALPRTCQHWGMARKILNIFLRDCLYTSYLVSAFHLDRAEQFLELPLDSITAKQLRNAAGQRSLQPWPGVKHLTMQVSASFQKVAADEASKRGIARVHLDAFWWSVGRDEVRPNNRMQPTAELRGG
jgi:hypothetical protein